MVALLAAFAYWTLDPAKLRELAAPYLDRPVHEVSTAPPAPAQPTAPTAPPTPASPGPGPDGTAAPTAAPPSPAATAEAPAAEEPPSPALPVPPAAPAAPSVTQALEPTPAPAPAPALPAATPAATPVHVSIRYRKAADGAEAQATRIAAQLRAADMKADLRPVATSQRTPTILFFRPEDQGAANALWASLAGEAGWTVRAGSGRQPPGTLEVWLP